MKKKITIINWLKNKKTVTIQNFEEVLAILCEDVSGDEVLNVIYKDKIVVFDSSEDRITSDCGKRYLIYTLNGINKIKAFSRKEGDKQI